MRKTGSVLAFILGACLIITWISMVQDDGHNAAANIHRGFEEMNTPAFDRDMSETEQRHRDERNYGLGGAVLIIVGFALWPYQQQSAKPPLAEENTRN